MKTIVLISCVAKKGIKRAKAKDLYISELFKYSLAYANTLKPDNIFVLSALHHVIDLDEEIDPYNVTLTYIGRKKREKNPNIQVLDSEQKKSWGKQVLHQLSQKADLQKDEFIVLAGQDYIKPIRAGIKNILEPLLGLQQGKRVPHLKKLML